MWLKLAYTLGLLASCTSGFILLRRSVAITLSDPFTAGIGLISVIATVFFFYNLVTE